MRDACITTPKCGTGSVGGAKFTHRRIMPNNRIFGPLDVGLYIVYEPRWEVEASGSLGFRSTI